MMIAKTFKDNLSLSVIIFFNFINFSFLIEQYYNDNPLLQKDSKDMKIILNKGEYSSIIDESGKFVLYNIPPGSYILETTSRILRFDTVKAKTI